MFVLVFLDGTASQELFEHFELFEPFEPFVPEATSIVYRLLVLLQILLT